MNSGHQMNSYRSFLPFIIGACIALTLATLLIRVRFLLEMSRQTTFLHAQLDTMAEQIGAELERGEQQLTSPAPADPKDTWHAWRLADGAYGSADGRVPPMAESSLRRELLAHKVSNGASVLLGPFATAANRNIVVLASPTRNAAGAIEWTGVWEFLDDLMSHAHIADLMKQGYRLTLYNAADKTALYQSEEGKIEAPVDIGVPFPGSLLEIRAAPRGGWSIPPRFLGSSLLVLLAVVFWLTYELRRGQTLREAVQDLAEAEARRKETNALYGKTLEGVAALESRLQLVSMYDTVSGLANRSSLVRRIESTLDSMRHTPQGALCVMAIGFDHMSHISNSFGADFSSRVLVIAAERIEHVLPSKDLLFRIGDFQLAVVLPQTDAARCEVIAQQLITEIQSPIAVDSHTFMLHPSVGIAQTASGYEYAETLLDRANTALGAVARDAPVRYCLFDSATAKESISRMQLEVDLDRAFEENEFVIEYEPFVTPVNHSVAGFEGLIRWNHPTEGRIGPARFVPIAVQAGMAHRLNDWVIRETIRQASLWRKAGYRDFFVNFNLSAEAFLRQNLAEEIGSVLAEFDVPGNYMIVELTESTLIEDIRGAARTLQRLSDLGVGAWLDDFGTGYSSLSHLRSLPLKGVKIDRSFVERTVIDARDCGFLKALIDLVGYLGLKSIAEGVETREQFELLSMTSCDLYQGYYFSRSMPAALAERWMNEAGHAMKRSQNA